MTRAPLSTFLLALAGVYWIASPANAEPPHAALIIANSQYGGLPALPGCATSAATVRDALRDKGFEVVERSDLGRGQFDGAIGTLARRAAAPPSAFIAVYYCGYALEFNGRTFLLPVSASIARDNDVLSQGVIARSLVDSLTRAGESAGFVMLDLFKLPGAGTTGLARLGEQIMPSRVAVIGAGNDATAEGPTAASQALRDQVDARDATLDRFVNGVIDRLVRQQGLAVQAIAAIGPPSYVVGGPPPTPQPAVPPPAAPDPPVAAPAPPAAVAALPPPSPPSSAGVPVPPQTVLPDEDRMSDQERRQIQVALATLGYYSGRIDGTFGPESRAAIRRYQFEIKVEQTGLLTGEQATRLVNKVR